MQAKDSSLADAGRYLILIAKTLKLAADDTTLDPDFLAHAYCVQQALVADGDTSDPAGSVSSSRLQSCWQPD